MGHDLPISLLNLETIESVEFKNWKVLADTFGYADRTAVIASMGASDVITDINNGGLYKVMLVGNEQFREWLSHTKLYARVLVRNIRTNESHTFYSLSHLSEFLGLKDKDELRGIMELSDGIIRGSSGEYFSIASVYGKSFEDWKAARKNHHEKMSESMTRYNERRRQILDAYNEDLFFSQLSVKEMAVKWDKTVEQIREDFDKRYRQVYKVKAIEEEEEEDINGEEEFGIEDTIIGP